MKIDLVEDACCTDPATPEPLLEDAGDPLVRVFRALGDRTRLDIFRFIAAQAEPICVCYVVDRFAVSQPTVSHHLKVLRDANLVMVSRRGVWAYYAATDEGRRVIDQVGSAMRKEVVVVA
jgi:ArsR family transcriptional regulator